MYLLAKIESYSDPDVKENTLLEAQVESILPHVKDSKDWSESWPSFGARDHADNHQNLIGNYILMYELVGLHLK